MSLVGDEPSLILDFKMYNLKVDFHSKNEGELNVAKKLLLKVILVHRSLVDIVAYDVLTYNSKLINYCIEVGVDTVIRVKKMQN